MYSLYSTKLHLDVMFIVDSLTNLGPLGPQSDNLLSIQSPLPPSQVNVVDLGLTFTTNDSTTTLTLRKGGFSNWSNNFVDDCRKLHPRSNRN